MRPRRAGDRVEALRTNLPNTIRGVLDASPIDVGERVDGVVDQALAVTDRALEQAHSLTTNLKR